MDEFLITYNLDKVGGSSESDVYNPELENYISEFEGACEEIGLQGLMCTGSDGDGESGMCEPEYSGFWLATSADIQDLANDYPELEFTIYEKPSKEVLYALTSGDLVPTTLWDELVELNIEDTYAYLA